MQLYTHMGSYGLNLKRWLPTMFSLLHKFKSIHLQKAVAPWVKRATAH
jgi:hypothetical protein